VSNGDAVVVSLTSRNWLLEGHSALGWINAISADFDGLAGVMPGLVTPQARREMLDLYWADPDDITLRCGYASRKAVQYAGHRPWTWTVNLVQKCVGGWLYVNGMLLRAGIKATEVTFSDWLDAAYVTLWEGSSEDARKKLEIEMRMPRKGMPMVMRKSDLEAFAAD